MKSGTVTISVADKSFHGPNCSRRKGSDREDLIPGQRRGSGWGGDAMVAILTCPECGRSCDDGRRRGGFSRL